ncbi:phosphatases II [Ramaria rubella]|nr:phosphatases II [Ramaria rubella]
MFSRDPDEIIDNHLYLGGLAAALDTHLMNSLGITHVLSVCPECTWDVPTHRAIHVNDTPDENLLIRLPEACQFIQRAIDSGGKIYVHCMMGVSRSVTVVCAYLMQSQGVSTEDALAFVKSRRPVARPNYGFMEQLDVWKACSFLPSVLHPAYSAWKRKHDEENGLMPTSNSEPTRLSDRLYFIEDLPPTAQPLASLLRRCSITHLLTMTPHQPITMSESTPIVDRCHLSLVDGLSDDLVLKLPEAVAFIDRGLKESSESVVLIHSFDLTRISIAACAYWMSVRGIDSAGAFRLLQVGLPLYSPTTDFTALLSLFEACFGAPSPMHPEILAFRNKRKEEEEDRKARGSRQNINTPWIMWQPPDQKKNVGQEIMDLT